LKLVSLTLAAAFTFASIAHAHPGHGLPETSSGFLHYALTPEHGPLSLLLAVALLLVARALVRMSRRG